MNEYEQVPILYSSIFQLGELIEGDNAYWIVVQEEDSDGEYLLVELDDFDSSYSYKDKDDLIDIIKEYKDDIVSDCNYVFLSISDMKDLGYAKLVERILTEDDQFLNNLFGG